MMVLFVVLASWLAGCDSCEPGTGRARGPTLMTASGDGGCPDPLFPVLKGASWTYEVSSTPSQSPSIIELEVLDVERTGRSLKARVRKATSTYETTVEAVCSPDGSSFLSLFVYLGPPLPTSLGYSPATKVSEGPLVPPIAKLSPGLEWHHTIEAHTERPGGVALTMDSIWSVAASYLGEKEVSVPAGTYLARQVKLEVTGHHRPPEEDDVVFGERVADPPSMTFTYSLAPGVGVVMIEGDPMPSRPDVRPRWVLSAVSRKNASGRQDD
jgi:hypothetical protein